MSLPSSTGGAAWVHSWVYAQVKSLSEKYSVSIRYTLDRFDNTYTINYPEVLLESSDFLSDEQRVYKEFFNLFPYVGLFFVCDRQL